MAVKTSITPQQISVSNRFISWGALAAVILLPSAMGNPLMSLALTALFTVACVGMWGVKHHKTLTLTTLSTLTTTLFTATAITLAAPYFANHGSTDMGTGLLILPLLATVATRALTPRTPRPVLTTVASHTVIAVATTLATLLPAHTAIITTIAAIITVAIIAATNTTSKTPQTTSRLPRVAAITATIMLAAATTVLTMPDVAHAGFGSWASNKMSCGIVTPSLDQQPVGTGPESVLPTKNLTGLKDKDRNPAPYLNTELPGLAGDKANNYTLYELAGLRGTTYINWVWNDQGDRDNCNFSTWLSVYTGNAINSVSMFLLQAVLAIKEFSQVKNPFEGMYQPLTPMVSTFYRALSGLYVTAFIIAVIIMAFLAARGKSMYESSKKVVAALTVAFFAAFIYGGIAGGENLGNGGGIFFNLIKTLDHSASVVNAGISNEVLSALPQSQNSMCKQVSSGDMSADAQRQSTCLIAESFAYQPWAIATFGPAGARPITLPDPPAPPSGGEGVPCYNNYGQCQDARSYLLANVGGPKIKPEQCANLDSGSEFSEKDNWDMLTKCSPYHAVANQLGKMQDTSLLEAYRGNSGGSLHITQALAGLTGAATVGIGVAIIGAAALYWQAKLLLMFVFGPFTLLMAAFRGLDHATKWGYELLQCVIARAMYGILSTVLIYMVAFVSSMDLAFGLKWLLMALLAFGTIKMLGKVTEMSSVGSANDTGATALTQRGGRAAMGAVAGFAGGRALGGRGRRSVLGRGASAVGGKMRNQAAEGNETIEKINEFVNRPTQHLKTEVMPELKGKAAYHATEARSRIADSQVGQTVSRAATAAAQSRPVQAVRRPFRKLSENEQAIMDQHKLAGYRNAELKKRDAQNQRLQHEANRNPRADGSIEKIDIQTRSQRRNQRKTNMDTYRRRVAGMSSETVKEELKYYTSGKAARDRNADFQTRLHNIRNRNNPEKD